jgi:hypothetical protein
MSDKKYSLIQDILTLDQDTYGGIDDPSFLEDMSVDELRKYLKGMKRQLGIK